MKQFGGRPSSGVLLLTTTGMLAAVLLPQTTTQTPMVMATECLGPSRGFIKNADICYGKSTTTAWFKYVRYLKWFLVADGHFLIAVSSGDPSMPVQCYTVSVKKLDDKCIITSQTLLAFFLFEAPKEALSMSGL